MPKKLYLDKQSVDFYEKVKEISGETITLCDQCGTCSGGCPVIEQMDISPAQLMRMVMLGDKEVMDTKTMWLCATCNTCTVRCPRELDVSKVAEALRQIRLRQSIDQVKIDEIPKDILRELPQIAVVGAFRRLTS
ncbi:MAG: 4Fe-4S dicluster domain-containing protein [Bacteroidota bacterium]|nr:4Fe-4S dicluster domain-containing protein [Bacteroidota bacterium]